MLQATIAPVQTQISSINWAEMIKNFSEYVSSPVVICIIIGWLILQAYKLGLMKSSFTKALDEITDLKKDVKQLLNDVAKMQGALSVSQGKSSRLFASGSPLVLLKKGENLLDKSGFKKIYAENKECFINDIKGYKVKTPADIDEASLKVVAKCGIESRYADYKEIAFQNGISLDLLLRVLSIYLRDEAIKEILKK